jgi:hypothetical protein
MKLKHVRGRRYGRHPTYLSVLTLGIALALFATLAVPRPAIATGPTQFF